MTADEFIAWAMERPHGERYELAGGEIVVEILSPSTRARDAGAKLEDYFRLSSVQHYLIVKAENRTIIRHRREGTGTISTRIVHDGAVRLDPPGIALRGLFG